MSRDSTSLSQNAIASKSQRYMKFSRVIIFSCSKTARQQSPKFLPRVREIIGTDSFPTLSSRFHEVASELLGWPQYPAPICATAIGIGAAWASRLTTL
jgi:hypothetical protein